MLTTAPTRLSELCLPAAAAVDDDFTPNPNLLPFGGFEVAVLLTKLHDNAFADERPSSSFAVLPTATPRSNYLRSKIVAASWLA